jgi:hypothetical protein
MFVTAVSTALILPVIWILPPAITASARVKMFEPQRTGDSLETSSRSMRDYNIAHTGPFCAIL